MGWSFYVVAHTRGDETVREALSVLIITQNSEAPNFGRLGKPRAWHLYMKAPPSSREISAPPTARYKKAFHSSKKNRSGATCNLPGRFNSAARSVESTQPTGRPVERRAELRSPAGTGKLRLTVRCHASAIRSRVL